MNVKKEEEMEMEMEVKKETDPMVKMEEGDMKQE